MRGVILCSDRGVGGGHPSRAEDSLEVKAGAGTPIPARSEGLGQLPNRARHRRRNQNLPRTTQDSGQQEKKKETKSIDWPGNNQQAANQ